MSLSRFCYSTVLVCLFFLVQTSFAQHPWETDYGLQSNVPMPASFGSDGQGATTQDPIFLFKGSVTETATDLTFPTPLLQSWHHQRTYDSGMTSGVAGKDLLGSHGHSWLGGNQAAVLTQSGDDINLVRSAANKRVFTGNNGVFTAPADFNATLVKRTIIVNNKEQDEYVLTLKNTGEVSVYYGFNNTVPPSRRGKLKERTNLQYAAQGLPGELYEYDTRGFVTTITTAYPQEYCICYTYATSGNVTDRLEKIEVYTGMPGANGVLKFAEAEYLYWESLNDTHDDVGTFGDLVQVKVSTLASDHVSWQTRITQYRYHRDGITDGRNHQIKAVFEPDAVERIIAANNDIAASEDILLKSDAESLASGNPVSGYASRAFTYYTANLDTSNSVATVWGTENLSTQYGGQDMDELRPLVDDGGNPVPGYFVPRVKTEVINAGCSSCGGGSSAGGVKKSYYYMQLHPAPNEYASGNPNAVTYLVVEDTVDSDNTAVLRTIYGIDYRGKELRRVDIENPSAGTLNTAAKSDLYDSKGKLLERRPGDAHIALDNNTKITQFLNPFDPTSGSWSNDTATLQASKGVIMVYEYDSNGNRTGTKKKLGSGGTAYYVSAADYNANDQITAEYDYPTQTANRAAGDIVTTARAYTYWDTEQEVIKTKQTTRQAVQTAQNGSNAAAVSNEYYDEAGRLRWVRNALGVVTYYGYHPWNGKQTLVVNDIDTASLPAAVTSGSSEVAAWNGIVPFSREGSLPTAFNQTRHYGYNNFGRLTKSINAAGVASYIVYDVNRMMRFSAWDDTAQKPTLPISVVEVNASNKPTSVYELPPTAVVVTNGKPSGISAAPKVSWTRYAYGSDGSLQYTDRYHTIPGSGTGTLGVNFYRTAAVYDRQNRQVAAAQYVADNKWQVNAVRFDWRDRPIENFKGVTTTVPTTLASIVTGSNYAAYLKTVSKNFYDGDLVVKRKSYFDTGGNDFTGANYIYDAWGRLRATESFAMSSTAETPFGPYNVNDYNWRGNVITFAVYETAPNWSTVASTDNYAANTAAGRRGLTKSYIDILGGVYQTETFEIDANGVAGNSAVVDYFKDVAGRQTKATHNGQTDETTFDALGRQNTSQIKFSSTVVAMNETEYDSGGRIIGQHYYDLNPGEVNGITPSSYNYTRRTVYYWHDKAGRQTVQADYGSGGAIWGYFTKPARPGTAPNNSSDSCLVMKTAYNAGTGLAEITTDPMGTDNKTAYDALDRTIAQWQNYKTGNSVAADEDVEVQFTYDGLDNIVTLTAVNPTTGNQVTKYLYEDAVDASLQTNAIYPDSADTTSSGTDQVKTAFYLDGNVKQITDQNGTVRLFAYDSQRRQIADAVTTLGSGVDGLVRKIGKTYDWNGALASVTSYDSSSVVLNEIKYEYDTNQKLSRLYQAHNGAVNTSTAPYLSYQYSGIADGFRITDVVYPTCKTLQYSYDSFNHLTAINEDNSPLVSYMYSGGGSIMQTMYEEPGVSLTYAGGGLDRFGRIVNHSWMKGNAPLVHILHGHDYAGNRLYRNDVLSPNVSELYTYDQVNQIKSLDRGTLNSNNDAVTASNFTEAWDFDKTGNWTQYDKNGTVENRTHNKANEIQGIATHDKNGNMVLMPGLKGKYDAWNRLVEVRDASDNLLGHYDYNGQNQRIKKTVGSTVTKSFFNEQWQELESTKEAGASAPELTTYVWGVRYIDDLILREKDAERMYSLADPNWNVVAVVDDSGSVVERMKYDAFGKITWLDAVFGVKNSSDYSWNRTFTGQVLDSETGLMLYRMRYYNTALGRFVSRDPIEYDADDNNIYRYVGNRTVLFVDTFGLKRLSQEFPTPQMNICEYPLFPIEPPKPWLDDLDYDIPNIFDTPPHKPWWKEDHFPPQPPLKTIWPAIKDGGKDADKWLQYGIGEVFKKVIKELDKRGGKPSYDSPKEDNPNKGGGTTIPIYKKTIPF